MSGNSEQKYLPVQSTPVLSDSQEQVCFAFTIQIIVQHGMPEVVSHAIPIFSLTNITMIMEMSLLQVLF